MQKKNLKIGILSRNANLYSTRRLVEAILASGHEVSVVDPLKCYIDINSESPSIYYKNGEILDFDVIIPRIGASITFFGTAVLRQFEMNGTYVVNPSLSITRARDKLRAHQLLARKGIGMPKTAFAGASTVANNLIDTVGGAPLVIKLLEGTQGNGVILTETQRAAQSLIDAFRNLKTFFLVQEFIGETAGTDIRCFVVGDKVVAAMERTAKGNEFRSNIHLGGSARVIKIDKKTREAAVKAAKILGLSVAGVDIVRSARGPLVLEVNSSPGLQGIETATGKDIASMIVSHIELMYKQRPKRPNRHA
jgi:ribosomal protein S6--L-glutamate ligase